MKYEFFLKEDLTKKQNLLFFEYIWKPHLEKNLKKIIWSIPFLLLGIFFITAGEKYAFFFVFLGIYLIFSYVFYKINYSTKRRKVSKLIDSFIDAYKLNSLKTEWEFTENYFSYIDYKCNLKLNWFVFKKFYVVEDNLILEISDNINANFILAKEEVGESDFNNIINFLNPKIKNK